MTHIESLTFDLGDALPHEQGEHVRSWITPERVAIRLQFHPGPPNWSFDLKDPEAAREFYGRQCAELGGAMLQVVPVQAAGVEALRGLFKYRAPVPGSLAMYHVGILWVPFQDSNFQVNIEAVERGTTGGREAAVSLILGDK